ncbi:Na/Pi cotransporter family protein [Paenibacillus montanisoli]|uniref:Na/Pi cotransporter family protein n=1 Tax=Paenibacillus montanisoli TaxID=2081970 RepID=A0A328U257_9BACL|nr:Na/Pi symporter [Paenibacillus montanisoli]RAP76729.1 Na/Pi cotransporter family protein [Paenibacillus montanisoli]
MLTFILFRMLGGFIVFMLGMRAMELAMHRSVGHRLQDVLRKSTATPLHGLLVGTATTAVLQSSTAVTVIAIGLVNAGVLTFPRTLGIILGTNIGTCLTTELIGLNLGSLGWPLLKLSLAAWLLTALFGEIGLGGGSRAGRWLSRFLFPLRNASVVIGGFALLLIGIALMQSVAPAVQATDFFRSFMSRAEDSVLWGLAAGTVLTAAVHSSAAVIGIVMGLAESGAMPLEVGVAIVLGANVGTCVTAVLAAIGGTPSGRFVALSHVLLNVGGAVLFAPLAGELGAITASLTPSPSGQIAHAQTIFNILCSLIALPICYLPRLRKLTSA